MSKGMIWVIACAACLSQPLLAQESGGIYKVVDEEGNVTYTDQRPNDAAVPMDLPELSVIKTDPAPAAAAPTAAEDQADRPPTRRELQRQFSDFRILQPQQEETFWGTANTVVVAWGGSQPIPPELSVRLYVDGQPRDVAGSGSVTLTLDRGEHQVYAELLDARKRPIVTTERVTFFIKQHSVGFNRSAARPGQRAS